MLFQANALEQDALEVLDLVRSLKKSFTPINQIPPEVLSLIPDYCDEGDADGLSITLTHVCRGWRNIFISRSSLWTCFKFKKIDKTRTYIQRSNSSPLVIYLGDDDYDTNLDAFSLVVPHLHRLKSLTIFSTDLPGTLQYFYPPAPLLEELDIDVDSEGHQVLDGALFNGDIPTLRKLRLSGVNTHLPWRNLVNLQVVKIEFCLPVQDHPAPRFF